MALHNELGAKGESQAEDYLRQKGYHIAERNWTFGKYEVDIIAHHAEFIIFVEVKTRSTTQWGNPEDAISGIKIKRIVDAADHYLNIHNIDKPVRFDIIAIVMDKLSTEIVHIEDAFLAPIND